MNREYQGGHFDRPERLFSSLAEAYSSSCTSSTDFKECIPEMYYMEDMYLNRNALDLGKVKDCQISDVALPPWAKGSVEKFVSTRRAALESDYVSEHLHEWIDLIFGYKQRGQEAVESHNVFYYLTYQVGLWGSGER